MVDHRHTMLWIDSMGLERITYLQLNTDSSDVEKIIADDLSNAGLQTFWVGPIVEEFPEYVPPQPYGSVGYKGVIQTQDSLGNVGYIWWPAPLASLFLGDAETLDFSNATVIAAVVAILLDQWQPVWGTKVFGVLTGYMMRRAQSTRSRIAPSAVASGDAYREIEWIDGYGKTTVTRLFSDNNSSGSMAAMQSMSTAQVKSYWEGSVQPTYSGPVAQIYASVGDYALMYCEDVDGGSFSITIPAPRAAMFLADQETVDLAYGGVTTLRDECALRLLNPATGARFAFFRAGQRKKDGNALDW